MYSRWCYTDSLEYVLENKGKDHLVAVVDVPIDRMPEHTYQDELHWAVWKKAKGYKLYTKASVVAWGQRILGSLDEPVPDGHKRLYRLVLPKGVDGPL